MNTLMRIMIDFYVKYLLPTNVYGIHIRVHEFAGMDHFVMCLCVCWTMLIRRILFSLKWDSSKCCRENMRRVMTWVTLSSSHFTWLMIITLNVIHTHVHDLTFFIFVPIPLPPCCIKWCSKCYLASSDALTFLNTVSVTSVYPTWLSCKCNQTFKPFLTQFFKLNVNWHGHKKSFAKSMTWVITLMNIIFHKPHCTSTKSDNISVQSSLISSWGSRYRWSN